MMLRGFGWCLLSASLFPTRGLDACTSKECVARIVDEHYDESLRLLQHVAAVYQKNSSHEGAKVLGPEPVEGEGMLEWILRLLDAIKGTLEKWGWGSSEPAEPTPEDRCTSGLFVKYSDVQLEENMEASFTLDSTGASCSSNTSFGPNECCVQFGVPISVTIHAVLPEDLTSDAEMTASLSGWYGWLPIRDSFSCKLCGEPCNACPSISQYLPSLFPCDPRPMPACPIPAGSVTDSASATLPTDVQQHLKGSQATVTYSLTRADGSTVTSGEIFAKAS